MTISDGSELISVILPVYNGEKTVGESVLSVLGQTYGNTEIIIIDDASDDQTAEIIRKLAEQDGRIKIITNSSNTGRLRSRLKAVDNANGEWIAFIDSDDLWQPKKLEKQLALRDSSGCDLIYTASAFADVNGNMYDWIMHVPVNVGYRKLLKQNIISNSSVMLRKKDFIKYSPSGGNADDMHEDFACWLCMLRDGLTACGIDEPLITYRVSGSSATGNKIKASSLNLNTYRYIGLNFFERYYYQACYAVNGLLKHRHFRKEPKLPSKSEGLRNIGP